MENKIPRKNSKNAWLVFLHELRNIFGGKFLHRNANFGAWIFKDPVNFILLLILVLASFMRLYKIGDYMTFLGDEGRDALVAYGILHGDFTLLGPRSSAADFYYGPIYYYFVTPFLWLFGYDPVGPAVMVAIVGIASVALLYFAGKKLFNSRIAALSASGLYAVSPLVVAYSRSSWNPNPLPFVSLLSLFLLYLGIIKRKYILLIFAGFLLGIGLQLQYLALFLGVIIVFFTAIASFINDKKIVINDLIKKYTVIFGGFLIGFSPFLAFELRNGFPNTRTILRYIFTDELEPINYDAAPYPMIVIDALFRLFGRLLTRYPPPEQVNISENSNILLWYVLTIIITGVSIFMILKIKNRVGMALLACWLILGVGLFGFYKDAIYDYHFGFLYPLPFLLFGNVVDKIFNYRRFGVFAKLVAILILTGLFIFNLMGQPFQYSPNRQKDQVKEISEFVLSKTNGEPFNFALLTLGNSDHAYRYFMRIHNQDPVDIKNLDLDPERKSVTDQLLIVCEDPNCKPLGHPLWEVAGFGRATISGEWNVSVVKVYKLEHFKE